MAKTTLSKEETLELIKEAQAGSKEAEDRVFTGNINLVHHALKSFKSSKESPEDLFQLGSIGLLKAINKFDLEYGVAFSTYAVPLIKGEVLRYFRDSPVFKAPRDIKKAAREIVENELQFSSPEDIIDKLELDMDVSRVKEALVYINAMYIKSADELMNNSADGDQDIALMDSYLMQKDVNGDGWFDEIVLREALDYLDDRERFLIESRFLKELTQSEISEILGVSQVQVSRIEKKVLIKLKKILNGGIPQRKGKVVMANNNKSKKSKESKQKKKELAIKLLSTTNEPQSQIAKKTGLSTGTIGNLAKEHRPAHLKNRGGKKAAVSKSTGKSEPKQTAKRTGKVVTSDNIRFIKPEERTVHAAGMVTPRVGTVKKRKGEAAVTEESTPKVTEQPSGAVEINFNYSIKGTDLSKGTAMEHLKGTMELLNVLPAEQVSLNVKVEK